MEELFQSHFNLKFLEPNHFMFCLNLHGLFPVQDVKHGLLCRCMNQKRCPSKKVEIVKLNLNDSKFYLDRTIVYISALLAVLLDWHNAITCISSM